jgi:hypothetical protein
VLNLKVAEALGIDVRRPDDEVSVVLVAPGSFDRLGPHGGLVVRRIGDPPFDHVGSRGRVDCVKNGIICYLANRWMRSS